MTKALWWIEHRERLLAKYAPVRNFDVGPALRDMQPVIFDLAAAQSLAEITAHLEKFCSNNGIDRAGVMRIHEDHVSVSGAPCLYRNMQEYTREYLENGMLACDPVSFVGRQSVLPIPFGLPEFEKDSTPEECRHRDFLRAWSSEAGMLVPLHGPGGVAVMGLHLEHSPRDFQRCLPQIAAQAQLLGSALHDALRRVSTDFTQPHTKGKSQITLTRREMECLSWVAAGKTAWEISCILNVSERTIVAHTENAKKKLGAKTLPQAVALAVSWGLIRL